MPDDSLFDQRNLQISKKGCVKQLILTKFRIIIEEWSKLYQLNGRIHPKLFSRVLNIKKEMCALLFDQIRHSFVKNMRMK